MKRLLVFQGDAGYLGECGARSMKGGSLMVWLAGLVAAPLVGCTAVDRRETVIDIAPTTGALALDVQNFAGGVEVRVDPRFETARVLATVRVKDSPGKIARAAALSRVSVQARIEEQGPRAVLSVRSTCDMADTAGHRADLYITLPRADGARVVTRDGLVMLVNTSGGTEIHNERGAVELRTSHAMNDPVTITTVDGSIYYQVPSASSGVFDLETLNGDVIYIDRLGETRHSTGDSRRFTGQLNDGGNPVVARTNRGDIRVWVDKDPVALTRVFKEPIPDPRSMLFLQGSRRYTRNLPEDHPEITTPIRTRPIYE